MKKTLMGTTALVAAAVAISGARADEMMAEPISLSVGGYSHWGVAIVDNSAKPNNDDIAIGNDVEVIIKGSTILDSGVEVGVRIEIEGEQSDDQGDETYAYIEGSFGTLRIGNDDPAGNQMGTNAPNATYFFGLTSPYWAGSFSSGGSLITLPSAGAGDSASLMYFSPVINGFQFGVSYAPEAGKEAQSAVADQSAGGEVISVGANYNGSFGDAAVTIGAGYVTKDVSADPGAAKVSYVARDVVPNPDGEGFGVIVPGNNPGDDPVWAALSTQNSHMIVPVGDGATVGRTVTDWAVGVSVSMSSVTIGGGYRVMDDDMGTDDQVQYDLGIMYGEGPWQVSVNWGHAEDQDAMYGADEDMILDTDFARLLANYNIGPGIDLAGAIGSDSPASGDDTTFAGVALGISF